MLTRYIIENDDGDIWTKDHEDFWDPISYAYMINDSEERADKVWYHDKSEAMQKAEALNRQSPHECKVEELSIPEDFWSRSEDKND